MKFIITTIILGASLAIGAAAEMETWTTKEGVSKKMKLLHVDRDRESASAKFQLEDGEIVNLVPRTLNEESIKRIVDWKPTRGTKGFFDHKWIEEGLFLKKQQKKISRACCFFSFLHAGEQISLRVKFEISII